MLPYIVDIGFFRIPTFGVFLVLAFFWGCFFLWKNILLTSYKEEDVFDAVLSSLIAALVFGRLIYVLINFSEFRGELIRIILVNGYPGIELTALIVGFFLFLKLALDRKKIPYMKIIDQIVPAVFLALAIGKMGAFFSGSEIGAQTGFILSLKYPNLDGMRHLTPLYESLLYFGATYIAYRVLLAIRKTQLTSGTGLPVFILIFSGIMLALDSLKPWRLKIYDINYNILIHGIIFLVFCGFFLYTFRNTILDFLFRKQKAKI